MKTTRRAFLTTALGTGLSASGRLTAAERSGPDKAALDRILAEPVLQLELFKSPVKIENLELLRNGAKFLIRARSVDGAESVTVPNNSRLLDVYPMYLKRVAPFFIGKDAREQEFSMRHFPWVIENRAADIIQPDLQGWRRALPLRSRFRNPDRPGLRDAIQAGEGRLTPGPILLYTTCAVNPQSWQKSRICSL